MLSSRLPPRRKRRKSKASQRLLSTSTAPTFCSVVPSEFGSVLFINFVAPLTRQSNYCTSSLLTTSLLLTPDSRLQLTNQNTGMLTNQNSPQIVTLSHHPPLLFFSLLSASLFEQPDSSQYIPQLVPQQLGPCNVNQSEHITANISEPTLLSPAATLTPAQPCCNVHRLQRWD